MNISMLGLHLLKLEITLSISGFINMEGHFPNTSFTRLFLILWQYTALHLYLLPIDILAGVRLYLLPINILTRGHVVFPIDISGTCQIVCTSN